MSQAMDVAELPFAVEDFLGPLAGETERPGKGAKELNDLSNVVIVLAIFRT